MNVHLITKIHCTYNDIPKLMGVSKKKKPFQGLYIIASHSYENNPKTKPTIPGKKYLIKYYVVYSKSTIKLVLYKWKPDRKVLLLWGDWDQPTPFRYQK